MKLSLAVADPNVAEFFKILRSEVKFVAGGTEDVKTQIKASGNVSMANVEDINALPEGDQIRGAMSFWCQQEMFATHADGEPGTSDILVWRGETYRVANVFPYPNRGYWKAIAVRMAGN